MAKEVQSKTYWSRQNSNDIDFSKNEHILKSIFSLEKGRLISSNLFKSYQSNWISDIQQFSEHILISKSVFTNSDFCHFNILCNDLTLNPKTSICKSLHGSDTLN